MKWFRYYLLDLFQANAPLYFNPFFRYSNVKAWNEIFVLFWYVVLSLQIFLWKIWHHCHKNNCAVIIFSKPFFSESLCIVCNSVKARVHHCIFIGLYINIIITILLNKKYDWVKPATHWFSDTLVWLTIVYKKNRWSGSQFLCSFMFMFLKVC